MAKKKSGIQGSKEVMKNLKNLMKDMGQKYSIRVGIIGDKAYEKQEGTDLTNAELGAIHEFGATINHPGGQPYYINSNTGLAVFVRKDSLFGQHLIQKGQITKPHQIIIPTRSFLRMPLLSKEGKKFILDGVLEDVRRNFTKDYVLFEEYITGTSHRGENNRLYAEGTAKNIDANLMPALAKIIGALALKRVQDAFKDSGFGNWAPITEKTKQRRKGDKDNPPLDDTGVLKDSITYEVKKVK